jgi:2-oxoglutarate ferredoxin oxidoreductase subunit beta
MSDNDSLSDRLNRNFNTSAFPTTWCPGCGIGTILGAITRALEHSGIPKEKFAFITGIGCYGGAGTYLKYSDIHALHGRCPAYATGLKLARPDVYPILLMGDGDAAAIGANHLIQAARRNIDLTAIIINNHTYGMTGGQYSPTTPIGTRAITAPLGQVEHSFDLCKLVESAGGTFVSRTTTYHVKQLTKYVSRAIKHPGFSLVEVESICPTYFGRSTNMPNPVDMLKWQKENSVSLKKAKNLSPEELKGKIITGIFVEDQKDEYVKSYQRVIEKSKGASAPKIQSMHPMDSKPLSGKNGEKTEIRLAGAGGQGIILAAIVLAEAAGLYEGKKVVQTQSYGVEARGGASRADVIISEEDIVFPEVTNPDILLAMNKESMDKFIGSLNEQGILIYNSSYVKEIPPLGKVETCGIPLTGIARDVGGEIVSNMVALGSLLGLSNLLSKSSLKEAIVKRSPPGTAKLNVKAFELGFKAGKELLGHTT